MLGLIHGDVEPFDIGHVEGFGHEGTHQLPVAVADGGVVFDQRIVAVPLPAALRVVVGLLATEGCGLVDTVEFDVFRSVNASEAEHRGQPVAHVEESVVTSDCGVEACRPTDDGGHADAAFVSGALGAVQLAVEAVEAVVAAAAELRAVVTGEYDECIFAQAELLDALEQAANIAVESADHGVERFDRLTQIVAVTEGGHVFLGRLQRRVWRIVSKMQVEGIFRVALDEVDRFVGPVVSQVAAIGAEHTVACFEAPVVVVVHAPAKANGFVKAALLWFVAWVESTEMPFADEAGAVARATEDVGDGHFVKIKAFESAPFQCVDRAGAMRVAASEQGGTGRIADRRTGVVLREAGAFLDELIQEGGFTYSLVEDAKVAIAEVVDQDVYDIWTCHRGMISVYSDIRYS